MVVATLIATVRRLTGAVSGDVADADVTAALAAHRVRETLVPVEWERVLDGSGGVVYTRGRFPVWGSVEPSTQATASANGVTVTQSDGSAVTGNWSLEADGVIVFASDQGTSNRVVLSAYSYDVNAACGEVMDQLVSLCAGDYTVKLGDQTFNRGEGADRLRTIADAFRRKALMARGTMLLTRLDEAPSPVRVRRRAGWR